MKPIRTFFFHQRNGNAGITLSAYTFEEAYIELVKIVKHPSDWEVEDEEGD